MTRFDPEKIETASCTDVGRQRSNNQDHYGEGAAADGARLLVVADGMGGHAGGATASRMAVETVRRVVGAAGEASGESLRAALEQANREVHDQARQEAELAGMGTTGVALLFTGDGRGWVANVGDSRAYRLREGELVQITEDHSLVAELQRRGVISEEEALVHPRRNEVLRSLGVEPDVTVDVLELDVRPGDQFLLCSDGLSGVVRDGEIAEVLRREPPEQAVRTLVDFANERGGPDNVTVQIARIPAPLAAPTGAARSDRLRRVRALMVALVVVALLLAAALLWALVGELRGDSVLLEADETPAAERAESADSSGRVPVAPE